MLKIKEIKVQVFRIACQMVEQQLEEIISENHASEISSVYDHWS